MFVFFMLEFYYAFFMTRRLPWFLIRQQRFFLFGGNSFFCKKQCTQPLCSFWCFLAVKKTMQSELKQKLSDSFAQRPLIRMGLGIFISLSVHLSVHVYCFCLSIVWCVFFYDLFFKRNLPLLDISLYLWILFFLIMLF